MKFNILIYVFVILFTFFLIFENISLKNHIKTLENKKEVIYDLNPVSLNEVETLLRKEYFINQRLTETIIEQQKICEGILEELNVCLGK